MADQFIPNFHHRPQRPSSANVPPQIEERLARGAGYGKLAFTDDLKQLFTDPLPPRRKLKDVARTWKSNAVSFSGDGRMTQDAAAWKCVDYFKFYHRFSRSEMREKFLELSGGDADKAVEAFLQYIATAANSNQMPGDLMKGLDNLMDKQKGDGSGDGAMPFGLPDNAAGSNSSALIAKAMRINELLPKLRRKYDFCAVKAFTRELSLYPEDDVDMRQIRSYGEMSRVTMNDMSLEDDLFWTKVARRTLNVTEHFRLIPQPKTFCLGLDVSGSMDSALEDGYKRCEYATAVAIAMLELADKGGNTVACIPFDGNAHPPIIGTPRDVAKSVWECKFSGGGTAFEPVFREFDKHKPELSVLITDGGASFNKPPESTLQVLICGNDGQGGINALKSVAQKLEVVV